ncbi:hypothetical protein L1987_27866 [Smallanthus sonchifolius]|uniref:Uncharacterized protein n=1 Tax=Smallanthus sonchifolius TaxID=185202 RepID=A0ACB9ICG5_9ASTR|nr:hypothetical protein L1987_27866 [Smallanthus sonchifolius]
MLHGLSNSGKCRELIHVSEKAFRRLCNILKRDGGLRPTQRMSVEEHVARFLHITPQVEKVENIPLEYHHHFRIGSPWLLKASTSKVIMSKHEAIGNTGKKEQLKWIVKMDNASIQAMVTQQDKGKKIYRELESMELEPHEIPRALNYLAETKAARNNLLPLKQKKMTLQAEVRFLRRRRKFLLQNKSTSLQERVFMNTQPTRLRKSKKDKIHIEKQKTLHNLPSPELDLILGNSVHGVNQQSIQRAVANQRRGGEEELQDRYEPFESWSHGLTRNVKGGSGSGLGSSGQLGKRKISWQDPVALTV